MTPPKDLALGALELLAHYGIKALSGLITPAKRPDYFKAARTAALEAILKSPKK